MKLDSALSSRRLARAGAAADEQVAARAAPPARAARASGAVSVPFSTSSSGLKPRRRKRRIVSTGPSSASGGTTTFTREPSGRRASHERLGLVDAAAERREDALDRVPQLGLGREAGRGRLEPAAALDPRRRGPADEDLVDLGVGEQRLERPEPERPLGDPVARAPRARARRASPPRGRRAPGCACGRRRPRRARAAARACARAATRRARPARPRGRRRPSASPRRRGGIGSPARAEIRAARARGDRGRSRACHAARERVAALGRDRDAEADAGRCAALAEKRPRASVRSTARVDQRAPRRDWRRRRTPSGGTRPPSRRPVTTRDRARAPDPQAGGRSDPEAERDRGAAVDEPEVPGRADPGERRQAAVAAGADAGDRAPAATVDALEHPHRRAGERAAGAIGEPAADAHARRPDTVVLRRRRRPRSSQAVSRPRGARRGRSREAAGSGRCPAR